LRAERFVPLDAARPDEAVPLRDPAEADGRERADVPGFEALGREPDGFDADDLDPDDLDPDVFDADGFCVERFDADAFVAPDFASPCCARCLLTMRAATSSSRPG
jgi:hypothetical protein